MNTSVLPSERIDDRDFEALYAQYFDYLAQIAIYKFQVPESEAETLVHDVLISYLKKAGEIADLHRWLVGAICHASRHYWRLNGRTIGADAEIERNRADPASLRVMDTLPAQIAARQALACLGPRYRDILRMRYLEGCSVAEVATHLGVKTKYAQKLITRCLRRAYALYTGKGGVR